MDNTLFSIVDDIKTWAYKLNNDLKKNSEWAYQWKKTFNPDLNKQAQDVIFSRKTAKTLSNMLPRHSLEYIKRL